MCLVLKLSHPAGKSLPFLCLFNQRSALVLCSDSDNPLMWLLLQCCLLGMVVLCPSEAEVNQKRRIVPVKCFQTNAAVGPFMFDLIPASLTPVLASLLSLVYSITLMQGEARHLHGCASSVGLDVGTSSSMYFVRIFWVLSWDMVSRI